MALVIIISSAMSRLCGVNICLRKDQRSLASRFVSVKVKVRVSDVFRINRTSFSCILPYNYLATSSAGLQISADEGKNRGSGGEHLNAGGAQQASRDHRQRQRHLRRCAARFQRSLGNPERAAASL